jgi:hypothetical protein
MFGRRLFQIFLHRFIALMREVGVLLIAFAPLDMTFSSEVRAMRHLWLFFALGAILFLGSIMFECLVPSLDPERTS